MYTSLVRLPCNNYNNSVRNWLDQEENKTHTKHIPHGGPTTVPIGRSEFPSFFLFLRPQSRGSGPEDNRERRGTIEGSDVKKRLTFSNHHLPPIRQPSNLQPPTQPDQTSTPITSPAPLPFQRLRLYSPPNPAGLSLFFSSLLFLVFLPRNSTSPSRVRCPRRHICRARFEAAALSSSRSLPADSSG